MTEAHRIDLHMHTTVSDGTDTPEEILGRVKENGIKLFAITDHDAIKGCGVIRQMRKPDDPKFLTGVEFSCRDEEGQYHILGYGYDPEAESMRELVEKGHRIRMEKIHTRLDFLKREFGIVFPPEEIEQLLRLDNPGKPHLANLLVKDGYAESKETAMRDYLNKLRIRLEFLKPEEAIAGILAGGGGIPETGGGHRRDSRRRRDSGAGASDLRKWRSADPGRGHEPSAAAPDGVRTAGGRGLLFRVQQTEPGGDPGLCREVSSLCHGGKRLSRKE